MTDENDLAPLRNRSYVEIHIDYGRYSKVLTIASSSLRRIGLLM